MRTVLILVMMFVIIIPAAGQGCGYGVPCNPVVWPLPSWPNIQSPTPANWEGYSGNPAATPTPTATGFPTLPPTAIPTLTPFMDPAAIDEAISTIQAISEGTTAPVENFEGTPVARADLLAELDYADFVGYIKGVDTGIAGPFQPLFNVGIIGFLLILLVKVTSFLLPVFMAIYGLIRKAVQIVLEFIPL